jgi:hypothetical protein
MRFAFPAAAAAIMLAAVAAKAEVSTLLYPAIYLRTLG